MSATLQAVLTVVEIVALIAVLAVYLLVVRRRLRSIASALAEASARLSQAEQAIGQLGPGAAEVNSALEGLVAELPGVTQKAEDLVARR